MTRGWIAGALLVVTAVVAAACTRTVQMEITQVVGEPTSKQLEYQLSRCRYDVAPARVLESATEVHLKAPETTTNGDEPDCAAGGTVTLSRPLGDRVVIDDATGRQIPVTSGDRERP